MKYNTRSSIDFIFLKEIPNSSTKKKIRSKESTDCKIIFSKLNESLEGRKEDSRSSPVNCNKLNETKQIKPCSVILEKMDIHALNLYAEYKLNQMINPCSVHFKRVHFKPFLNYTKLFQQCSVVLKKYDFEQRGDKTLYKVKQEIASNDKVLSNFSISLNSSIQHETKNDLEQNNWDKNCFNIKQKIETCNESSFTNSLSHSSNQSRCIEQEKNKQFKDSNSTIESEILLNEYYCSHCNKVLPSKKALYYHTCSNKIKKGFLCEICFKNFDFYHLLTKHKSFHTSSLSCSNTVKSRKKSSSSPFVKSFLSEQSLRKSNKFNCVSAGKSYKLKENHPPKKQKIRRKIFLKNPTCASTSSGYCSPKLEFFPIAWESDESGTEQ